MKISKKLPAMPTAKGPYLLECERNHTTYYVQGVCLASNRALAAAYSTESDVYVALADIAQFMPKMNFRIVAA